MCFITEEDWKDFYSDEFSEQDIDILRQEVRDLGLNDIITFDDNNCKIIGYRDLKFRFDNDLGKDEELFISDDNYISEEWEEKAKNGGISLYEMSVAMKKGGR